MLEIRTVLCPIDFTPLSDRGLELAIRMCQRFGARLVLEHNLEAGPPDYLTVSWMWSEEHKGIKDHGEEEALRRLEGVLDRVPRSIPREAKLTRGPVDQALLYLAREIPADLVVMGTHGWSSAEHRSLTEQIITASPCPVLTTTEGCGTEGLCQIGEAKAALQVVVPVDFSLRSRAALGYAFALAETLPAHLHLVHVAGPRSQDEPWHLDQRLEELIPDEHREHTDHRVVEGAVAESLARLGREMQAHVMVMGVRPKGLLQRFASGVTAFEMLHDPTCPVWFVPAEGKTWGREVVAGSVVAS